MIKYSKELLEPIVKESFSYQEVMRKLGLKISGGSSSHLKSRFILYGIDISHFTGRASNRPKSHRAVGTACGANPIAIFVPCHRAVKADGTSTGFRWGLTVKQALMDRETI